MYKDWVEDTAKIEAELIFPNDLIKKPVIYQLALKYDVPISIIGAKIDENNGYMKLLISGSSPALDGFFEELIDLNVEIEKRKIVN